jgi:hypothetical protein
LASAIASSKSPKRATPTIGPNVSVLAISSSIWTFETIVGWQNRPR